MPLMQVILLFIGHSGTKGQAYYGDSAGDRLVLGDLPHCTGRAGSIQSATNSSARHFLHLAKVRVINAIVSLFVNSPCQK